MSLFSSVHIVGNTAIYAIHFYFLFNIQSDAVYHGTPITKETFVAWKEQFDAKMAWRPVTATGKSDSLVCVYAIH